MLHRAGAQTAHSQAVSPAVTRLLLYYQAPYVLDMLYDINVLKSAEGKTHFMFRIWLYIGLALTLPNNN